MQKHQDMRKAHSLSKPNLVGGLSLSTPGTTGPQKRRSSAHTPTLHPPQIQEVQGQKTRSFGPKVRMNQVNEVNAQNLKSPKGLRDCNGLVSPK